jgi:hypothetical protein
MRDQDMASASRGSGGVAPAIRCAFVDAGGRCIRTAVWRYPTLVLDDGPYGVCEAHALVMAQLRAVGFELVRGARQRKNRIRVAGFEAYAARERARVAKRREHQYELRRAGAVARGGSWR